MKQEKEDIYWMAEAISLARKGQGKTSPNPCVGAIVVKSGKVVGSGFHKKAGEDHAEVIALKKAGSKSKGSTIYITLEPCSTYGKTPPCIEKIIESGIKRVVFGALDPNSKHTGKSKSILLKNKIKCTYGVLKEEAENLITPFRKWVTKKNPYVTVKVAQSLDGKIASFSGDSKWITSKESRDYVQFLRSKVDAVLMGIQTIQSDDPRMNVRIGEKKNLTKVIVDSSLQISKKAKLFKTNGQTIIVTTSKSKKRDRDNISKIAKTLVVKSKGGKVDFKDMLKKLAQLDIVHLLVEGGGEVIASFFEEKLVDEIYFFIAPKIIGGRLAKTSVEGKGVSKIKSALSASDLNYFQIGDDLLCHGFFK